MDAKPLFFQNWLELLGVAGFLFYMLAYGLLQFGKIAGHSYCYALMNLLAAALVLISLLHQFNLASALIQVSWIIISIIGVTRLRLQRRNRINCDHPFVRLAQPDIQL